MKWLLSASLCAIAGSSVLAGARQPESIESQAREARRVVIARVASVQPRFDTNQFGDQLIVSDIVLEVEETLKGAPAAVIQVTVEGGSIGELTLNVSDMPVLRQGDRAILFLDEPSPGRYVPHKRGAGVLKVDSGARVNGQQTLADVRNAVRSALR